MKNKINDKMNKNTIQDKILFKTRFYSIKRQVGDKPRK